MLHRTMSAGAGTFTDKLCDLLCTLCESSATRLVSHRSRVTYQRTSPNTFTSRSLRRILVLVGGLACCKKFATGMMRARCAASLSLRAEAKSPVTSHSARAPTLIYTVHGDVRYCEGLRMPATDAATPTASRRRQPFTVVDHTPICTPHLWMGQQRWP
jgi:hypothetical protein